MIVAWAALLSACKTEPIPLRSEFDGGWDVLFRVEDSDDRDGTMDLVWDDEEQQLTGEIAMEDPGETRVFEILDGEDIEDFGIALQLIEQVGVRQLFVELAPPEGGDTFGGWRTRWGCNRNECGEDGSLETSRR